MPGLEIMLPIAVGIALCFLGFFLWSVRNGEYDDAEMTAHRILFDEKDDIDRQFGQEATKADSTTPTRETEGGTRA